MSWIEPLSLETWIINVFTGTIDIFTAVAIIVIMGMAGYFRMNVLTLSLMLGLFFIMFMGYINFEIYFIFLAIAALLIGFSIGNIVKK